MWDFDPGGRRTTRALNVNGTYSPVAGDFTGDDVDDLYWYAAGRRRRQPWDFAPGGSHSSRTLTINTTYRLPQPT